MVSQRTHFSGHFDDCNPRASYRSEECTQSQVLPQIHGHGYSKSTFTARIGKPYDEGADAAAPSRVGQASPCSFPQRRRPSNLESFVLSTTPSVLCQHLSKSKSWEAVGASIRGWSGADDEAVPFFTLSDVWEAYEEWSVYGCGVPLSLNTEENVVQYYVPYLSAMQLYTRSSLRRLDALRRCDDGESCESEYKDSSSEASDSDGERNFPFAGSDSSSEPGSDSLSVEDDAEIQGQEWEGRCRDCREKHRVLEYFEHAAPYGRVPFTDKVAELQAAFPALKSLRSIDMHPASWFSVAWYPVYRIPTGPTLRDLGACFLTYHSVSTPISSVQEQCVSCAKNYWISTRLAALSPTSLRSGMGSRQQSQLCAFGLASYKLKGPVWFQQNVGAAERRRLSQLQSQPERWLQQQQVHHPDFEYFRSHSGAGGRH